MASRGLRCLAFAAVLKATGSLTWTGDDGPTSAPAEGSPALLRSPRGPSLVADPRNATTIAVLTQRTTSSFGEFPVYVTVILVILVSVMWTTLLYYLCRCIVRRRKREDRLATLTPTRAADPRMAGVRADQPIEFVVPTTTTVLVSETTEDSISETDYSSGGCVPGSADRRRKRSPGGFQIRPGDLQRGLYEGVAPPGRGDFLGDLGKIGFVLGYSLQRSQLTVRVIGATDLPEASCTSPCVKLSLLPDRSPKHVTKVVKNTTRPLFNESFAFWVRRDQLPDKKLKLSVWDYDRFSRKCLVGQVVYDLKDSGLTSGQSVDATSGEIWVDLKQDVTTLQNDKGEILLSLCYDPDIPTLTLTVLKVRGLDMRLDKGKENAVYAKVTLYVRKKLLRTKKTPSRKKSPEVEFHIPFSIHVPPNALREVDLVVTVWEKWPLGGRRVLGRTQAGPNCLCEQGLHHWQDMLDSPKSTCAQWHTISA